MGDQIQIRKIRKREEEDKVIQQKYDIQLQHHLLLVYGAFIINALKEQLTGSQNVNPILILLYLVPLPHKKQI